LSVIVSVPVGGNTRILWEYVVGGYMRYKPAEIAPAVDKVLAEQLDSLAARLGPVARPPAAKTAPAGKKGAPARSTPPEPADEADAPSGETPAVEPADIPLDVPDESKAEEPAPPPARPSRPGKRQVKPDDQYVEPTR
jgi:hypothetical protein